MLSSIGVVIGSLVFYIHDCIVTKPTSEEASFNERISKCLIYSTLRIQSLCKQMSI